MGNPDVDKQFVPMKCISGNVFINKMCFHAFHGVMAQEQQVGGDYLVDINVEANLSKAVETDMVVNTIDYSNVYRIVKKEMEVPSALVEHVAGRIAEAVFAAYPQADSIRIKITKVNPPMGAACQGAGVEFHFAN